MTSPSTTKRLAFWVVLLVSVLLLSEMLASTALVYHARWQGVGPAGWDVSPPLSSVALVHEVLVRLGVVKRRSTTTRRVDPAPFYRADPLLGYVAGPGAYTVTWSRERRSDGKRESFKTRQTIEADGSRWTGPAPAAATAPSIYIFGDSFVFGTGVNDEQTFAYLLQQAVPDRRVLLFALGGYGLTQSYLQFDRLRPSMRPGDLIVLGYADFYDERTVMAPSRLRYIEVSNRRDGAFGEAFRLPKASVSADGTIEISYVDQRCAADRDYCARPNPSQAEMTRVSAALINHIAARAPGRVYVLHFDGKASNPLFALLTEGIVRVSALPADFDYVVMDRAGFDAHPGPYWHYAMSRKLIATLSRS